VSPEEVTRAEEAPLYNVLPENRSNMPCLLMDPVVLWENIKGGKLLCGVLHDESQKLLKKVN